MRKYRLGYAGIILVSLLFLFLTGSHFLAAVCVIMIILPLVVGGLLRMEAGSFSVTWGCRRACQVGQEITLHFSVARRSPLMAAGVIQVTVDSYNILLDRAERMQILIPITERQSEYEFSQTMNLCGEIRLSCPQLQLIDIFGLCKRSLPVLDERVVTVYPDEIPLQLVHGKMPQGILEGEQISQIRKGNDQSEVFDLREYHPGDDVRSIHWKLSTKTETMMIREASDTSRFDTLLLFDAGLYDADGAWDKKILSDCVGLGLTVSHELLKLGIPHCTGMLAAGELRLFPVAERTQYDRVMDMWMGIPVPTQCGMGFRYWQIHEKQMNFTNILYVTAGNCPEEVFRLSPGTDMTAVCLTQAGDQVAMTEKGLCHVLKIPQQLLRENSLSIYF